MKLLIDISNFIFGGYMAMMNSSKNHGMPTASKKLMVKEWTLKKILDYTERFRIDPSSVIIAWDSGSWRRDYFPYYKQKRRDQRDGKSDGMFEFMDEFKKELLLFPFKHMMVSKCEADDIIGILARIFQNKSEHTIIISRDKDFLQLVSETTKILDPFTNKVKNSFQLYKDKGGNDVVWHVESKDDAKRFTIFHILLGDASDGIPNIVSEDDSYIVKKKSERFGIKTILSKFFDNDEETNIQALKEYHHHYTDNFKRNSLMVDLNKVPLEYKKKIIREYNKDIEGDIDEMIRFCQENSMFNIIDKIKRIWRLS